MINRVIISGVLENENYLLYRPNKYNHDFSVVEAKLLTHNGKKDEVKEVKIVLYNKLASDLVNNQEIYKNNLCMYYGEVVYNSEKNETRIKINEPIQVLASVGE